MQTINFHVAHKNEINKSEVVERLNSLDRLDYFL